MDNKEVELAEESGKKLCSGVLHELKVERLETVTSDLDFYEAKCGSIYMLDNGGYTFFCDFCDDRFKDMESFGWHLEEEHISYDFDEVVDSNTEEGDDCEDKVEDDTEEQKLDVADIPKDEEPQKPHGKLQIKTKRKPPNFYDSSIYCTSCRIQFANRRRFLSHQRYHRIKEAKLNRNNAKSEKPSDQTPAVMIPKASDGKTTELRFTCDLCDRKFKKNLYFREHVVRTHGDEIPKSLEDDPSYLKCRYCNLEFNKATKRYEHENTHDEEKPFRCSICPRVFSTNIDRGFHEKAHSGVRSFPCPYCPKSFTYRNNREQHIRIHLDIKRFSCDYCDKKFTTNVQRKIHIRVHEDDRPFQCEQCGSRFRTSSHLLTHRKRHANQRNYKCDECGKQFVLKNQLDSHKVSHSTERPFECSHCEKTFTRKAVLTVHEELHSSTRKYGCDLCGEKFAQSIGLYTHMKKHAKGKII